MRKVAYQCKLTSGEIAPRKPRSDIGCRRKHGATKAQKAKRSRRTDSDSESDSSSSRKDDNNGLDPPARKRCRTTQYKSMETIEASD